MLSSKNKQNHNQTTKAFTIVELLIVIAVIGILALIVIVAFNGVRTRAIDSRLQADVSAATTKLESLRVTSGTDQYPENFSDTGINSTSADGQTAYYYFTNAENSIYCLQAINSGRSFFATNDSAGPEPGVCDGTTGTPTDGNYTEVVDLSGSESFASLSGSGGVSQSFTVDVPADMDYVHFHLSGGTEVGTFGSNLRVRQGAAPTSGTNDCQSVGTGNYETCYMSAPSEGTWYIEVYLYNGTDSFSGVTLTAEWGYWSGAYEGPATINGEVWARDYYSVEVPSGTDYLSVWTANGTETDGGANLAIRQGSRPGTTTTAHANADCYSVSNSNFENCFINNPTPGTWYISVFGGSSGSYSASTYQDVDLQVDMGEFEGAYSSPVVISAGPWSRKIYSYTVPSSTDYVSFTTYGGTDTSSGANLAVRYNAIPGIPSNPYSDADCYSVDYQINYENCFMYNPSAGTWYASVFSGNAAYTGTYDSANFKIEHGDFPGAYPGPVSLSGGYGYRTIYSVTIPGGTTSATFGLAGGTETGYGANLAVKYNSWPGLATNAYSNADCYSHGSANTESCVINNPTAGTWYVSVFSGSAVTHNSTFDNVTLTVSTAP